MTTYSFPFQVDSFQMQSRPFQLTHSSPYSGSDSTTDLLNDRLYVSLTIPLRTTADGAAVEAWITKMRGQVNKVNLWHMGRPVPRGTLRGNPTVGATAKGASTFTITASSGETVLAGDVLKIGDQLFYVIADATTVGSSLTVTTAQHLRTAITTTTAVLWDRPTVPFTMIGQPAVTYLPGYSSAVQLDFREHIA